MAKKFIHVITVRSAGLGKLVFPFPIDMLRYDSCYPRTERDSGKIALARHGNRRDDDPGDIQLIAVETKAWRPTNGRWKSFSYDVVDHEIKSY